MKHNCKSHGRPFYLEVWKCNICNKLFNMNATDEFVAHARKKRWYPSNENLKQYLKRKLL